jgi:hypothetical protein
MNFTAPLSRMRHLSLKFFYRSLMERCESMGCIQKHLPPQCDAKPNFYIDILTHERGNNIQLSHLALSCD